MSGGALVMVTAIPSNTPLGIVVATCLPLIQARHSHLIATSSVEVRVGPGHKGHT
jgi:hypothetical protein